MSSLQVACARISESTKKHKAKKESTEQTDNGKENNEQTVDQLKRRKIANGMPYNVECDNNLIQLMNIAEKKNETHALNTSKHIFFNTVKNSLSRHRQGNKQTGVTQCRMMDMSLHIGRTLIAMGAVPNKEYKTLLAHHVENVDMHEFAVNLMGVLQAFLFLQTYCSGASHCQRITYSTQEVQTDDTMFWPLEAGAEEILPPGTSELMPGADCDESMCVACMHTFNVEITKMNTQNQEIVNKNTALVRENEAIYKLLEHAHDLNRELEKRNAQLESRLLQQEASAQLQHVDIIDDCENTVPYPPDNMDFVPWIDNNDIWDNASF
jgi:hypothetical protein